MSEPDASADGNDEPDGGELLDQYLTVCELLCRPEIEGLEALPVAYREAIPLAPPDVQEALELLILHTERFLDDPSYVAPSGVGGPANWTISMFILDVGFDAKSYVRNGKARQREALQRELLQSVKRLLDRTAVKPGMSFGKIRTEPTLAPDVVIVDHTVGDGASLSSLWRALRSENATSGLWPLFIGELYDEMLDSSTPTDTTPETLDGQELLRRRQELRRLDVDTMVAGVDAPPSAEAPATELLARTDASTRLLLLRADRGSAALASLGWSDGSAFSTHEHAAILRYLEDQYGAELAAIDGASIELLLAEPTLEPQAADDRVAYGDTTYGTIELEPEQVRPATRRDTLWGFWFD